MFSLHAALPNSFAALNSLLNMPGWQATILFQYGHFCQETGQSQEMPQTSNIVLNQDTHKPNCLEAWLSLLRGRDGSYTQIPLSLNLLESRVWMQNHP